MIAGLVGSLLLKRSLWIDVGVGVAAFIASILLHQRYQTRAWRRIEQLVPVLFSSDEVASWQSDVRGDLFIHSLSLVTPSFTSRGMWYVAAASKRRLRTLLA